jgi:hypothetical protein
LILLAAPAVVFAQTDEIQVYDAEIAERGVFNLMIHTNFTPIGRKLGDFPGAIIPNDSVNGTAEFAYGVTDWFEQGLSVFQGLREKRDWHAWRRTRNARHRPEPL